MITSTSGYKEQAGHEMPEMIAYGDLSYADYLTYLPLNKQKKDVVLFTEGTVNAILTETSTAGTYKGFAARIFVTQGSIPGQTADMNKECKFMIMFDESNEWEKITEIETEFDHVQLLAVPPIGLQAKVTTPYEGTGGTVTIKVTKRGGTLPYDGVAAHTNIQVIEAPDDVTCAIATVAQGNKNIGSYVVTMTASLAGKVLARITAESGSKRTYVSAPFYIKY
jgi:hypothetical protein